MSENSQEDLQGLEQEPGPIQNIEQNEMEDVLNHCTCKLVDDNLVWTCESELYLDPLRKLIQNAIFEVADKFAEAK